MVRGSSWSTGSNPGWEKTGLSPLVYSGWQASSHRCMLNCCKQCLQSVSQSVSQSASQPCQSTTHTSVGHSCRGICL